MAPCLEDCSNEVMQKIALLLDLDDVRNLRLSSRSLAAKCSHNRFFLTKRVDLTEAMLRQFVENTRPGRLGCLVQEITLVGIAGGARESNLETPETSLEAKIDLLTQAFSGILMNSVGGRLPSLSLEAVVALDAVERRLYGRAEFDRDLTQQTAKDTFDTTWHALAASHLPIESFNVFDGSQMQRCCLASNHLGEVEWEHPGLATSLGALRSLSVNLCNRHINLYESNGKEDEEEDEEDEEEEQEKNASNQDEDASESDDYEDNVDDDESTSGRRRDQTELRAEAEDESNFLGLPNLLRLCKQLDNFELHYFRISNESLTIAEHHHKRMLQRVAEMDTMPMIYHCSLRGVYAREEDLLTLVRRASVRRLTMEYVVLCPGTFRSIFDHCQSQTTSVEAVQFEDLFEDSWLVYFDAPGQRKLDHSAATTGCETLQRRGPEMKTPISYYVPQGGPIGSPSTAQWMRNRRKEYGPG